MPYTLNGFGTAYWGKAERIFRRNGCAHCGNVGDLASYETTKYFVALFIPLIPLGKVRVFDECPSCRRHGAMKLRKWERLKETEIEEALASFRRQPTDAEIGCRLLQVCAAYGDETQFLETSKEVLRHHGRDATTLALVSEVLEEYGHLEQAEAALRRSLQGEESPEGRRRLRWLMIRNGRPEQARPGLAFAYAEKDESSLSDLYLLVEGFQAQGQHREALAELEAIEKSFPDEAETPVFLHLRQLSEARFQTGEAVVSVTLQPPRPPAPENDWSGKLARWGSPALLLLLLGLSGWWLFNNGTRHAVYFVNGLDTAYSVEVAGRMVELPAGGHIVRRLPLRRSVSVTPAEGAPPFEPFEVRFDISFRDGFDSGLIPVVNADRTALILWETVDYFSGDPSPRQLAGVGEAPWTIRAGQSNYVLKDVDYPFKEFPEQIELSSDTSHRRRSRLGLLQLLPLQAWSVLQSEKAVEGSASAWIKAQVSAGVADEEIHPYLLMVYTNAEEFRELAGERLAAQPVEVGWHRAYQTLLTGKEGEERLEEEYRGLLSLDPGSSDLMYLLSRVTADSTAADRLLDRALEAAEPTAWPLYGGAIRELTQARFEPALILLEQALKMRPGELAFQQMEREALLANRRFETLAERSQEARDGGLDLESASDEVMMLAAAGLEDEAEAHRQKLLKAFNAEVVTEEVSRVWKNRLEGAHHLGSGNLDGYGEAITELGDLPFPLHRALIAGDAALVETALRALEEPNAETLLLAHLACLKAPPEGAASFLARAIARLQEGDAQDRAFAVALADRDPVSDPESLLALRIMPSLKAAGFAVLARRGGRSASALRNRARELAYDPGFEGRLLQRLIG